MPKFRSTRRRSELVCLTSGHQECVPADAYPRMVTGVFCIARCSRIRRWLHKKDGRPEASCSRFLDVSYSHNSSNVFFFVGEVITALTGSADSHLFVCRDHSVPSLLSSKRGLGSVGFRWSYAHARLISGVQKASLDVHDISLASGRADVLGCEVSPASACCCGTGKRISRICSGARTVSSRRRFSGRAMELVNGHESFLALSNRGALSILDASFKFARSSYLVAGEPWSTVRMDQRTFRGILSSSQ